MSFKITASPENKKVEFQLKNLKSLNIRGIRQAFYFLGKDLKATANKNILELPRFGTQEKYKGRRRRRSRAGESFANRSGKARKQLGFFVKGGDSMEFGFRQDSDTEYVKFLEDGTSKMGTRPTLKISVDANNRNAESHFKREIKKAHKEGFK